MPQPPTPITPALFEAALKYIPANVPREDWSRLAMAIKAEFPNDTGRELFTAWSETADNFDGRATRATWHSVKAGGGITGATLLFEAKARGFDLAAWHRANTTQGQAPALSPAQQRQADAERSRQRTANQAAELARKNAAQAAAAIEAAAQWQAASESGSSPYLERKGVQPHGLRFALDALLVPLRDAAGKLWNLQRIAPAPPTPPDAGPDKLFLKGGRVTGLFHVLHGTAAPADIGPPAIVLVAEGYATAASLHQATGYPVAMACHAGNLGAVARALRELHPAALIVVCGDDDQATQERTGSNPGRDKATAAARAVQGLAVFPEGLPAGASDFNDMHQAAGLDAVRATVAAAIEAHQATAATTAEPAPVAVAKASRKRPTTDPTTSHDQAPDTDRAYEPFALAETGVWFCGADQDGKKKPPEWLCSRLDVQALTRDQDGTGWGYLLAFDDPLKRPKQWAMPARMLSADGGEYRATLLNMGLRIATTPRARNLLTQYIQSREPTEFASCTDRTGWHGRAFVLPHETIDQADRKAERIVFQSDAPIENTYRSKGTPEQWRKRVGALCVGNTRMAFAVACAFAGPLLRPAGMESGGFHYRGDSSSGKTTALKLAASVYGGPSFLQRWRATDNALESIAAQHNDGLLPLDELAQIDPKTAGECAYMLANGQGKARATRTGTPRSRQAWLLVFLSAGEVSLPDHMAEGQRRTRTGQEVRMADIPADAGANLGAFEALHGFDGGAALAKHLTAQAGAVYGATGRAWLQHLADHADTLKATIQTAAALLAAAIVPPHASGQVERVGARFALVGAAGELATAAGLTGWPVGESERAARACFTAWLAARGGSGNGEVVAMLRQVRRFLEQHGEGRFTMWHRAADDHSPKTLNRAGVRRMLNGDGEPIKANTDHQREFGERMPADLGENITFEYFVLPEAFKAELCNGFDAQTVARVLLDHGCLTVDQDRLTVKPRLPGIGHARCYHITPALFALDL